MRVLYLRYRVRAESPERALSSLIRCGVAFSSPTREEDGFSFSASLFSRRGIRSWAESDGLDISSELRGLFQPIIALKRRFGIIFGTILSLFLIYLSTFYVWSVKIEGNSSLSDGDVVRLLQECGFGEGTRKASVDVNELQNTALARCHELSFLSVNIHGMVADVVVHERQTSAKAVDGTAPYNLVADTDGVVVSSLVLDGHSDFRVGDTVYKGQLLVSGIVDSTSGEVRVRHARGKVYARTDRELTFEIPLCQTEKKYIREDEIKGVRVLGKSLYIPPRETSGEWDMETEEKEIRIAGLSLPLTYEIRRVKHYVEETVTLTPAEAEERAMEEYMRYISTELDSAEILKETFSTEERDGRIILTAEVSAIENIAIEKKFEITE